MKVCTASSFIHHSNGSFSSPRDDPLGPSPAFPAACGEQSGTFPTVHPSKVHISTQNIFPLAFHTQGFGSETPLQVVLAELAEPRLSGGGGTK